MKTRIQSSHLFRNLLMMAALLLLMAIPVSAQAATQKTYTIFSSNTRVYSNTGLTVGYGWIYGTDEVTINNIYTNYCKVTYPAGLWRTKTGYVPTRALFTATSGTTYTARASVTAYKRPGGAKYGTIYKNDRVLVLGTSGSYTQVRYPVSGGYKFAFVTTSDCNAYIKNAPTPTPTPVPNTNIINGTYLIRTRLNNKCLDVHGLGTANGTNIEICSYNGGNNQKFNVTHVSNGWYKIIDVNSGKAIDVAGGVKGCNVNVQLYGWNGTDAQLWKFVGAGNGYYYIQNKLGYYLDVYNNQTADGTNVMVYSLNGGKNQQWKLEKTSISTASTLCITGNTAPGTLIQGSGFTVKGIVSSNYKISKITVGIYTTSGSSVSAKTISPNAYSYDINKIDSYIHFSYCKAGNSYVYKVTATDSKISNKTLQSTTFSCIAKPAPNKTITVFRQQDSRWKYVKYGYSDTAGRTQAYLGYGASGNVGSGCGVLALTNAVYYLNGTFIEPSVIATYSLRNGYRVNGVGTSYGLYSSFANNRGSTYGFSYAGTVYSWSSLKTNLNKGYVAICGKKGHIMAIVDYNASTGKYLLLDSVPSSNRGTSGTGYVWATQSYLQNTVGINSTFYMLKSTR